MFARKSERTSSKGSYESESGEISRSEVPGGRGGRIYDGPRDRVRRGRSAMLPISYLLAFGLGERGWWGQGYRLRGHRYLGERWSGRPLPVVSEVFEDCCLRKGERHTGIFANISIAEESAEDFRCA